jgi:hypothetical protein
MSVRRNTWCEGSKHDGMERNPSHAAKRNASQVTYEREFWFDISEVFNRAPT